MTPNPRTIESSTSVAEAAKIMKSEDVGSIPLVEGDRPIGMLTDRDIVMRVVAEGGDPQSKKAGEIASHELVTVDPDQSLEEAAQLMARYQIRRLPVVEEDGRLVGILAQGDVAQAGDDSLTGEIVERISQ